MKELSEIEINLDSVQEGLKLWISSKRDGTLFDGIETAIENNEARFQLIEGCYYDYEISDDEFMLGDIGENIIQQHKRKSNIWYNFTKYFCWHTRNSFTKKGESRKVQIN